MFPEDSIEHTSSFPGFSAGSSFFEHIPPTPSILVPNSGLGSPPLFHAEPKPVIPQKRGQQADVSGLNQTYHPGHTSSGSSALVGRAPIPISVPPVHGLGTGARPIARER